MVLNNWSLCNVMDNIQYGLASDFEFKWTTIFTGELTCASIMPKSKLISLSSDNYQYRFYFNNVDVLEGTPYVPDTFYVSYLDHKHELVFKLKDVENTYDNSIGTITWTIKWAHADNETGNDWEFIFPSQGVIGDYKRNSFYSPTRRIYINGQFEEI